MRSEELLIASSAPSSVSQKRRVASAPDQDAGLRGVAQEFETAFVAEMLKAAKVGEVGGAFTGGPGEEAFRSFLTREYADALSRQASFGLADKIYAELKQKVAADVE